MEILLELLVRLPAGIILAFTLGRQPSVNLAGGLLAGLIGGCCVPVFFVGCIIFKTGSDLCIKGKFDRDFNQIDLMVLMRSRAFFIAIGILIAVGLTGIGWPGLNIGAAQAIAVLTLLYRFGIDLRFWGVLTILGFLIWVSQYFGISNAPLCAIVLLSGFGHDRPLRMPERVDLDTVGCDPAVWVVGLGSGAIPAINSGLVLDRDVDMWTAVSLGTGFTIGLNLCQRDISKSAIGATMSQFSAGLDVKIAIVALTIALIFYTLPGSINHVGRQTPLPSWFIAFSSIAAAAWYGTIPDQPFLTLVLAGGGYFGIKLISKLNVSWLPYRFQFGLAAAPTLLL